MKEYSVTIFNTETNNIIDEFEVGFENISQVHEFMQDELHNYDTQYYYLDYTITE